jgi:ADP-heptose:LPS heptosyltransferase
MYLNGLPEQRNEWIATLPLGLRERGTLYTMDLRAVVTSSKVFRQHISKAFARIVNVDINTVRPVIAVNELERRAARMLTVGPYVVLSWHSVTNPKREDGSGHRKDWPMDRWQTLVHRLVESGLEVFVVGSERDPFPIMPNITPLYGLPIKVVAALLEQARCVVTLENGIAHLAAAVDAPMVEIYSDMMPKEWAFPAEATACKVLYGNPYDASLNQVWEAIQEVILIRSKPSH